MEVQQHHSIFLIFQARCRCTWFFNVQAAPWHLFSLFASVSWGLWFLGPNLSSGGVLDTTLHFKGGLVPQGLSLLCVSTQTSVNKCTDYKCLETQNDIYTSHVFIVQPY